MSCPDDRRHGPSEVSRVVLIGALIIAVTLIVGCGTTGTPAPVESWNGSGPVPRGYYPVRDGDTLYSIASRHKLDFHQVARWNGIGPPFRIYAGKLIRLESPDHAPVARSRRSKASTKTASNHTRTTESTSRAGKAGSKTAKNKPKTAKSRSRSSKQTDTQQVSLAAGSGVKWRWPLSGQLTQTYRQGDRTRQGIRISGRSGQMVKAAGSGAVVYSGSGLKGYGNLIIVKHNKNYLSAYGFNRRLLVSEGDRVKGGQNLAEVGQGSNGAHILHFEIRRNGTAVDPLRYLPSSR